MREGDLATQCARPRVRCALEAREELGILIHAHGDRAVAHVEAVEDVGQRDLQIVPGLKKTEM